MVLVVKYLIYNNSKPYETILGTFIMYVFLFCFNYLDYSKGVAYGLQDIFFRGIDLLFAFVTINREREVQCSGFRLLRFQNTIRPWPIICGLT